MDGSPAVVSLSPCNMLLGSEIKYQQNRALGLDPLAVNVFFTYLFGGFSSQVLYRVSDFVKISGLCF